MNHKQQQQPGTENLAAAAEAEPHSSRHDFGEVRRYCLATKRHATNPGGLARKLWRSGEEDKEIADWLEAEAAREARRAAKPDADPLAEIEREEREQAELEALLRSLPSEEYERLYEQGRREIVERCPAAQGWNQDQLRPPVEAWIKQQLRA